MKSNWARKLQGLFLLIVIFAPLGLLIGAIEIFEPPVSMFISLPLILVVFVLYGKLVFQPIWKWRSPKRQRRFKELFISLTSPSLYPVRPVLHLCFIPTNDALFVLAGGVANGAPHRAQRKGPPGMGGVSAVGLFAATGPAN